MLVFTRKSPLLASSSLQLPLNNILDVHPQTSDGLMTPRMSSAECPPSPLDCPALSTAPWATSSADCLPTADASLPRQHFHSRVHHSFQFRHSTQKEGIPNTTFRPDPQIASSQVTHTTLTALSTVYSHPHPLLKKVFNGLCLHRRLHNSVSHHQDYPATGNCFPQDAHVPSVSYHHSESPLYDPLPSQTSSSEGWSDGAQPLSGEDRLPPTRLS